MKMSVVLLSSFLQLSPGSNKNHHFQINPQLTDVSLTSDLLSTVLTCDLELHLFLRQDVLLPVADGAGVRVSVSVCGVFQGQTEVSSFQGCYQSKGAAHLHDG